jgi:hypothetical protein
MQAHPTPERKDKFRWSRRPGSSVDGGAGQGRVVKVAGRSAPPFVTLGAFHRGVDDDSFREFVVAAWPALSWTAYLLNR